MWVGGVVVGRVVWWVPWIADCLVQLATRASKLWSRKLLLEAVPERVQLAADVGRWCSGWASGVMGAVDRWLSGPASHERLSRDHADVWRRAGAAGLQLTAAVGR